MQYSKNDPFLSYDNTKNRLKEELKKYGSLLIAFDFDYTVHDFKGDGYTFPAMIELLRKWRPYAKFMVFTASPESRYSYIESYLKKQGIPFDTINDNILSDKEGRKIYYNVFLDDRAGLLEVYTMLNEIYDEVFKNKIHGC